MGDDIRIKVGVSSSVKAGMDQVVKDVNSAAPRMGKAGGESGKGFAEAFGKVLRGDLSGAIEDLQQRMGGGMKGMAAKATVWGAGIATAFVAGWKAGVKLDEMLGISDKLGAALAKMFGTQEDELTRIKYEGIKRRRAAEEKNAKFLAELAKKQLDDVSGFEQTEEGNASWNKRIEAEEKARIDAERARREGAERAAAFEADMADRVAKQAKEAEDAKTEEIKHGIQNRIDAIKAGARDIGALEGDAAKKKEAADAAWANVDNPGAARNAEREAERAEKRRQFLIEQARAARARGVTGGNIDRVLAADAAQNAAAKADRELRNAQIQQARDIADIKKLEAQILAMK